MAWRQTREQKVTFADSKGNVGGFARSKADQDQTVIGPLYSPNGTAHWIVTNDAGALSTVTTDPT